MRTLLRRVIPIAAAITSLAGGPLEGEEAWVTLHFDAYNREYVDVRTSTRWERDGAIQATLSSPSHRLSVRDHSVDLRPGPEGAHHARIRVNFSGEGEVVAEIGMAGTGTTLEDYVTAPQQEVEVSALIRFTSVEGGYEIETLKLQESIEVDIESRLGTQMAGICNSALAIFGADCSAVLAMFTTATIDLPKAGGVYFVPEDRLSRAERHKLDRYLAAH